VRRLMTPVEVRLHAGRPVSVRWHEPHEPRPRLGRVARILDDWDYVGRWWEREVRRHYLLLETDEGRTLELYREGEAWWLSRLSD
jgi:hypothetical protein